MRITGVEAYLLSFSLPEPFRARCRGEQFTISKRDAMLIRISTDEAIFGYAPGEPTENAKRIIDRLISPFLRGLAPDDPDTLRLRFQQGAGADAEASRIYSSVEIALYDLAGKARNVAVSELIGGRVRDRIRTYGSAPACLMPEESANEAMRARDLGFPAYKIRAGGDLEEDLATVHAVRSAAGSDFDVMVDASAWWSDGGCPYDAVERAAREMADSGIRWLEEPLPSGDHESYARLRQSHIVPLAGGAREPNELRFMDLIETGAVDYVQMNLVSQGGYATARRLFPDIARAGLRFAFHSCGTALDLIAAAHLAVCWPESVVRWLEHPCYFAYPFPLATEILRQPLMMERGRLIVPQGPGLGVEVDESVIWRYPWIEGAASEVKPRAELSDFMRPS